MFLVKYAIQRIDSNGNVSYFDDICYHGEVGYYPNFLRELDNSQIYDSVRNADFIMGALTEVHHIGHEELKVVPVGLSVLDVDIPIENYYKR